MGPSREPPVFPRCGWTSVEAKVARGDRIHTKAAPLQALGDRTPQQPSKPFEHEDDYRGDGTNNAFVEDETRTIAEGRWEPLTALRKPASSHETNNG